MTTARVNGIDIYYEVHGRGPPLLLIMGLGASASAWWKQLPDFSRCYRVVAFDNRGAGRSDKPNEPYTIAQMADDAAGLLDALGIPSAHVFGMSLGGMIAQELALRRPQQVRTLVLGATACGGPQAIMAGPEAARYFMTVSSMTLQQAIAAGQSLLYSDSFLQANRGWLLARALETAHLMPPGYALRRQFMAVLTLDTYDRLHQIQAPTLVITGAHDKIVPAANSRLIAERIPGARLIELPGAGHGMLVECAEAVNAAVLQFLAEHSGA
jgi:pimeloyl-ACP methyl ester carboxylesterase